MPTRYERKLNGFVCKRWAGPDAARVGFFLEGGYDRTALTESVAATIDAIVAPGTQASATASPSRGPISARHAAELAIIEETQRAFWKL